MILFWSLLTLVAVLLYIGYPLIARVQAEGSSGAADKEDEALAGQRERLLSERESVFTALSDLEFDHQMGDISEEDYEPMRVAQRRKAVAILRELDSTSAIEQTAGMHVDDEEEAPLDRYVEDEIARARRRLRQTDDADAAKDDHS